MKEIEEPMYSLDEVDRKILELLEKDARMSLKDMAAKVYLSSTAVSSRIERLKKAGVIEDADDFLLLGESGCILCRRFRTALRGQ